MTNPDLRFLFLDSNERWSGRERWILDAAQGLAERGHSVLLAAPRAARLLSRAREARVPTRSARFGGLRGALAMRGLLGAQRPHAVFVAHDTERLDVCRAARLGRRPLVFQRRRDADDTPSHAREAMTRCSTCFLYARAPAAAGDLPPDVVRIVRDGVDVRDEPPGSDRTATRRSLRLPRKAQLVVHVGSLGAAQETTLHALASLQERDAQRAPTVVLIGTGAAEPDLRDLCHRLGVQDRVLWLGFRADVAPYLAAADALVLPSGGSDVPHVVLEALAQGVPVVAARSSGAASVVQDGVDGILVAPADPGALAAALQRLLQDQAAAAALARRGLQTVRDGWSLEAMLDDLESLVYARLLRRQAPRTRAALFLDRDGTIVDNVPYNSSPHEVQLVPDAARALRWVRDAGVPMIVISNQSGVARGLFTEEDVHRVNARMRELLAREGSDVDAIYFCPHHPDHGPPCTCRKPEPGLLLRAAAEHGIDLRSSLIVGDAQRDLDAGARAGTQRAGLAVQGKAVEIADGENVYDTWTALVRDFLRALYSGSALAPRPRTAVSADDAVSTRSG